MILTELNVERKRFVVLNRERRGVQILKSSNRKVETTIMFQQIIYIQRSLLDHRQVMMKVMTMENILLFTFSSVYKVLQFLELYTCYSSLVLDPCVPARNLRILVLTYNMNRKHQAFDMKRLIEDPAGYDLIVIGGQEAKMTQKTSIIMDFANYLGEFKFITVQTV